MDTRISPWISLTSVLVCASSNAACDEIAERLIKILNNEEVFRMNAKTVHTAPSENIKFISNQIAGKYEFPSLEYLKQFPVIICTIHTAASIAWARETSEILANFLMCLQSINYR